jgi:hypothetical protein
MVLLGKTAVVTALVLAAPAKDIKPMSEAQQTALVKGQGEPRRVGLTLVVVNNTLVRP